MTKTKMTAIISSLAVFPSSALVAQTDELPAWQYQPPASVAEVGIVRVASDSCQQLVGGRNGCMMSRVDAPIEDFFPRSGGGTRVTAARILTLDEANEHLEISEGTTIPAYTWIFTP